VTRLLCAYFGAGLVILLFDLLWLHVVMRDVFRENLGSMMVDQVRVFPAALFYLGFAAALVWFAILPAIEADSLAKALLNGALLGLVAYGTYDLTNLATLKPWTWKLLALDVGWGTLVSAIGAAAGFAAVNVVSPR
jgi:uncharacterized membrane protein